MAKELKVGSPAPDFELTDKDGLVHKLSHIKSKFVVVYFYPKDSTPGCTLEAREFTKDLSKFEKLKATVIGISGGDDRSKSKFCSRFRLRVLLLSDPDFSVAESYGAYGVKSFMGRKFKGVKRKTFVLDQDRRVLKVFDQVKALGHSKEVLEFISSVES